jgi:hypothetical protein
MILRQQPVRRIGIIKTTPRKDELIFMTGFDVDLIA